jgi:D-alanyl-D-alanine carboxypeptidase (penicillin-binding protein 5/6)
LKNKIFAILLSFVLVFNIYALVPTNSYAEENVSNIVDTSIYSNLEQGPNPFSVAQVNHNVDVPDINAEAGILIDADASKILYEKNSSEKLFPASTTKLLTAIVVMETCKDLNAEVTVSYYAVKSVPNTYQLAKIVPGETFTIDELMNMLMVVSANEAAFVLAQYVGAGGNNFKTDSSTEAEVEFKLNIAKFSDMMNERAKSLGCTGTHFVNPNGIHDDNHYTTALDLAIIGQTAYRDSYIRTLAAKESFTLENSSLYKGTKRTFKRTNLLMMPNLPTYYEYANGMKTGNTNAAGQCIVASAQKDDRNLICVILKGIKYSEKDAEICREADCKKLFEYGFTHFNATPLVKEGGFVRNMLIMNAPTGKNTLNLVAKYNVSVLLKDNQVIDVTPVVTITKSFAPIKKGEVCGYATFTVDDQSYKVDLISDQDVTEVDNSNMILITVVGVVAVIGLIALFTRHEKKKYRE